jgi:hypothetical protein
MKRTLLVLALALASLALLSAPAAAASVSGTVTVENGTADGATVTVTPMDSNFRRVAEPANVTVSGDSFEASNVTDAPMYFVRVDRDGVSHYALVQKGQTASIRLGDAISGRVVDGNGTARSGASVRVVSELGPPVASVRADENGTFSIAPVKTNATYRLRVSIGGVPYTTRVRTGENATDVVVETPPPTDDESRLVATGGRPASHVVQLIAPQNESGRVTGAETLTLKNPGERPFAGEVTIRLPAGAEPFTGMYRDRRVPVAADGDSVTVNATIAAGESARVGVAYELPGTTLERTLARDVDKVAVVLRGYEPGSVNHSENLAVGDAPIPLLTNDAPLSAGDSVRVELPENPNATAVQSVDEVSTAESSARASDAGAGEESDGPMPRFPATALFAALAVVVAGAITAYRVL